MKSFFYDLGFIFSLLSFGMPLTMAQPAAELKTYVMDIDAKEIRSVSMSSGNVLASVKLDKDPSIMLLSPDKTRLLVFQYRKRAHAADR